MWRSLWQYKKLVALGGIVSFTLAFLLGTQMLQASPSLGPYSIAIQNVSPMELTFLLETETGQKVELGTVLPSQSRLFESALPVSGEQFVIHAKDPRGFEFYTLYIDRDEIAQRKGYLKIPGPGGRRMKAMRAPAVPAPTPTP